VDCRGWVLLINVCFELYHYFYFKGIPFSSSFVSAANAV